MKPIFDIPKLHIWSNQLLFVGASHIPYREHQVVSDKLLISIEGEITITVEDGAKIRTRSCLTKAGATLDDNYLDAKNATMAIYYLAPLTQDYAALENVMTKAQEGLHFCHPREDELIAQVRAIRDESLSPEQAYTLLRDYIVAPEHQDVLFTEFDPRIVEVVQSIRETVRENLSINEFAASVSLSESRLEKLFKEQIGVPITKYRLRYRVFVGIIQLALGRSVTEAALAAGFASSAHFSKSFSSINGIPPSTTFLKPPFLEVLISKEVLESLKASGSSKDSRRHLSSLDLCDKMN
jgi:AraC-like DNA-binding protein